MKIRDDLDGVVYVSLGGDVVVLKAGDDIPEGAEVGDHLIEGKAAKVEADDGEPGPAKRRGGRPRQGADKS